MKIFSFNGKNYDVDDQNFLINFEEWDENFAIGTAPNLHIPDGLTEKHWKVIRFVRDSFKQKEVCPLVYETCRANGLSIKGMKELFPTGYMRGACKLAGITYRDRIVNYYGGQAPVSWLKADYEKARPKPKEKFYRVDVVGFLADPLEWDENFAIHGADEIEGGLTDKHWKLIYYLRDNFKKNNSVPTLYECCEANQIELDELERLFPRGYHRGLVKIAGLRVLLSCQL